MVHLSGIARSVGVEFDTAEFGVAVANDQSQPHHFEPPSH